MKYLFLMLLVSCSTYDWHYTKKEIVIKCLSTEPHECQEVSDQITGY